MKRDPDSSQPISLLDVLYEAREKLAKLNDKISNLQDEDWIIEEVAKTKDKRNEQEQTVRAIQEAAYNLGLVDEFGHKIDPRNGQLEIVFSRDRHGDDGEQLEFEDEEHPGPAAADESEMAVEHRPSRPRRVRDAEPVEATA